MFCIGKHLGGKMNLPDGFYCGEGKMAGRLTKSGFTLIELLVVIGIISLMFMVAMSSLQQATQLAGNTICAANLSGIGKAVYSYLDEFEGTFPVWEQWDRPLPGGKSTQLTWWYMDLAKTMGWEKLWTHYPATLEDEETWEDPGMFLCPFTDRSVLSQGSQFGNRSGWTGNINHEPMWPSAPRPGGSWFPELLSYGWNVKMGWYAPFGTEDRTNNLAIRIKANEVMRSDEKILIADSDNKCDRDSAINGSWPEVQGMGLRHSEGANILFADSHVDWGDPYKIQVSYTIGSDYPSAKTNSDIIEKYWDPKAR